MIKKEMIIKIVADNSEIRVYPEEIEKCAGLNYSINFKRDGITFLNISCEYFKHNLKFEDTINDFNIYSLYLR